MAEGLEPVEQVVEEVAQVTQHLTGREVGYFITGLGLGIAGGFAVGYFVAGKRLELKYKKLADDEISEMREHYQKKAISLEGQLQRRRPLEELIVERGYAEAGEEKREFTEAEQEAIAEANARYPVEGTDEEQEPVVDDSPPIEVEEGWNWALEVEGRQKGVPYIIHIDEFLQNEPEHTQVTYMYYEDDDILADIRDEIIHDQDRIVGLGNLGRWGHGSNDPNITYVRNEELDLDIEIVRHANESYSEATNRTIRHSGHTEHSGHRRRSRRFDDDD